MIVRFHRPNHASFSFTYVDLKIFCLRIAFFCRVAFALQNNLTSWHDARSVRPEFVHQGWLLESPFVLDYLDSRRTYLPEHLSVLFVNTSGLITRCSPMWIVISPLGMRLHDTRTCPHNTGCVSLTISKPMCQNFISECSIRTKFFQLHDCRMRNCEIYVSWKIWPNKIGQEIVLSSAELECNWVLHCEIHIRHKEGKSKQNARLFSGRNNVDKCRNALYVALYESLGFCFVNLVILYGPARFSKCESTHIITGLQLTQL